MSASDSSPYAGAAFGTPGQPAPLAPGEWIPSHSPTDVLFAHRAVDPPAMGYVQTGDTLTINVTTLTGYTDTVTVFVRLLLPVAPRPGQPDGTGMSPSPLAAPTPSQIAGQGTAPAVVPAPTIPAQPATIQQLVMTIPVASGATKTATLQLPEGYILSAGANAATQTIRGTTFVRAWVQQRGSGSANIQPGFLLFADYVTKFNPVGWPGSRVLHPTEGSGAGVEVTVGNPSAGADWSVTVPTTSRWRVSSLGAQLVTSASAGTRDPRIAILSGGSVVVWRSAPQQTVSASLTVLFTAAPAAVSTVVDTSALNVALPSPCILMPGQTIQSLTTGLLAGDQWSNIVIATEQWIDAA